jgi:hypothetical protein
MVNFETESTWKEAVVAKSRYYYPGTCLREMRKSEINSVMIVGVLAEIRNDDLSLTGLNSYL